MSNYLPLVVRNALSNTGWSENEVTAYSSFLEFGAMGLTTLSNQTNLPVSTLQHVIKKLNQKRMIKRISINGNPAYRAATPDQLNKWIKGYSKQIDQYKTAIGSYVSQYDFNPEVLTPKVKLFQGHKGVMSSYRKMLDECRSDEICSYFSIKEELDVNLRNFLLEEFIPTRIKKSIKNKNIALNSGIANVYYNDSSKYFNETKLIERDSSQCKDLFNTEINFFDDWVHCMTYEHDSAFAMLIEDKGLASVLKLVFSTLWPIVDKVVFYSGDSEVQKSYHVFFRNGVEKDRISETFSLNFMPIGPEHPDFQTAMKSKRSLISNNRLIHTSVDISGVKENGVITVFGSIIHILEFDSDDQIFAITISDALLANAMSFMIKSMSALNHKES